MYTSQSYVMNRLAPLKKAIKKSWCHQDMLMIVHSYLHGPPPQNGGTIKPGRSSSNQEVMQKYLYWVTLPLNFQSVENGGNSNLTLILIQGFSFLLSLFLSSTYRSSRSGPYPHWSRTPAGIVCPSLCIFLVPGPDKGLYWSGYLNIGLPTQQYKHRYCD